MNIVKYIKINIDCCGISTMNVVKYIKIKIGVDRFRKTEIFKNGLKTSLPFKVFFENVKVVNTCISLRNEIFKIVFVCSFKINEK